MGDEEQPKYRAYRQEWVTDGLVAWQEGRIDNTVEMTTADIERLEAGLSACAPSHWIKRLRDNANAALNDLNPAIRFHAHEICAILDSRDNDFAIKDKSDLAELDRAQELWHKIVTIRLLTPKLEKVAKFDNSHRTPGAVSKATKFMQHLAEKFPGKSAKAVLIEARAEAKAYPDCPFDFTDECDEYVFWDNEKNCGRPFRWFEKRLSEVRNAPEKENPGPR